VAQPERKRNPCLEADLPPSALEPGTRIKKSRMGKWRALALVLVWLVMVAHFVQWRITGRTLTPVEPSESMEFSKHGVINAGLIFFGLAIASTLVLGRWFCGWACHVVALQDLAGWLLKKFGLRPKHVDLGLLGWVPWLACVYMFLTPVAYALIEGQTLASARVELMTEDFWATFPNWATALLTFAVVGFAIVWFLGAKGFCYYGCPYGGIFGVVDQLAPVRIRVTDACSGCGHCTAVCTSNVRVHEEVRDWKAVVDPGCMKCLDCVSVCPNDALYVGFGAPALFATRRTPAKEAKPASPSESVLARFALRSAFFVATMAALLASNPGKSDFGVALTLALAGFALLVALPFGGRAAPRKQAHTLGEEVLLGATFLVALFGIRGQHVPLGLPGAQQLDFPFLFSMGLAAILAFGVLQVVRMLRRPNVSLQSLALRASGRVTRSGAVFAGLALPLVGLVLWRAYVHVDQVIDQHAAKAASMNDFAGAEQRFREALEVAPDFIPARENLAGMLCAQGRFPEGIEQYRIALRTNPNDADTHAFLARALCATTDLAAGRAELERALEIAPQRADLHEMLSQVCALLGDQDGAARHAESARQLGPPR
jgi:polyferredoxin